MLNVVPSSFLSLGWEDCWNSNDALELSCIDQACRRMEIDERWYGCAVQSFVLQIRWPSGPFKYCIWSSTISFAPGSKRQVANMRMPWLNRMLWTSKLTYSALVWWWLPQAANQSYKWKWLGGWKAVDLSREQEAARNYYASQPCILYENNDILICSAYFGLREDDESRPPATRCCGVV
jgi:hypothetical protein